MTAAEVKRFWDKVDRGSDAKCWWWMASLNRYGYGQFRLGSQVCLAHRLSWELVNGNPVPAGKVLDHLPVCRNRQCVNPAHLEPVTPLVNTLRGEGPTAINARKTHCIRGHEFTLENTGRDRGQRFCRTCREQRIAA